MPIDRKKIKEYIVKVTTEETEKEKRDDADIEDAKAILYAAGISVNPSGQEGGKVAVYDTETSDLGALCVKRSNKGEIYYNFGSGEYYLADNIDAKSARKVLEISQYYYEKKLRPKFT